MAPGAPPKGAGRLTSVHLHHYAKRTAYNAIIEVDARPSAFVPGGHTQLGFDPQSWTPTDEEALPYLGSHRALDPFPEHADLEPDDPARTRRTPPPEAHRNPWPTLLRPGGSNDAFLRP